MKKNIFEVFKQINEDDAANGTGNLAISNALVSANKVKAGGHVTMGTDEKTVLDIVLKQEEKIVLLLVVDRKTYNKFADGE